MLPKITMKAPPQIDGGQIHASQSGKNYNVGADRLVVVDSVDVRDLLGLGFVQIEGDGSDADAKDITTSVSLTSATQGAQAFDPDARSAGQRSEVVEPAGAGGSNAADHGGAIPPHSDPSADGTDARVKADAELEAKTAAAAGKDPSEPSAQAQTGAPNQQAATKDQQQKAADKASEPARG
jgi:hypothetical protein